MTGAKASGAVIKQEMAQERDNQRFHQRIFENADPTSADVEAVGLRFTPQDRLLLDQPAQLRILP